MKVLDFAPFRGSYVREFELSHSNLVNRIIKITHAHNLGRLEKQESGIRNPESGIRTGIGTGTGTGTGIVTGMGRETYIKAGITFTLI